LLSDLPCRLVVVGSGPFDAEFDRLASQLGIADRITKVGFVPHDKAPDYLSAFDVVVLPSETQSNWKEQFGRVILESLACGTPVIGSDSGEIPVLIRETRGGHVFPERQSDKLAECIRRCAGDPTLRQSVREFSTDFVLRKYSLASIAASFASTIESALAHPISEMPHGHAAAAK
jgi:glycosyltransferase involved in cell wall biosynthesis